MSAGEQQLPLGESDWDDQDLLTIDEASERLVVEIAALRESLHVQPEGVERDKLVGRLNMMERVLESLTQGPTPLASVKPKSDRFVG